MSAPIFKAQSMSELVEERNKVVEKMKPYSVEILRRLRDAEDIDFNEEKLLDRYETLTWIIGE